MEHTRTSRGGQQRSLSSKPHKRRSRRTKAEIAELENALCNIVAEERPTSCRSVFYRMVSRGHIDKTEAEYQRTVVRLLTRLRREGRLPFRDIVDGTRLRRQRKSFRSLEGALRHTKQTYRQYLWDSQDAYVEVWSEKEAIAGVLLKATWDWDVPLLVCRGYPSLTYLHDAAFEIERQGKPAWLYYFGDHDPSGVDISRKVESELRHFAPEAEIHFERVAVTPQQIEAMDLPTRPTKRSDSRAKGFDGRSVEVDAIPPATLREIASDCITRHIDPAELERARHIERSERETLDNVIKVARDAG